MTGKLFRHYFLANSFTNSIFYALLVTKPRTPKKILDITKKEIFQICNSFTKFFTFKIRFSRQT